MTKQKDQIVGMLITEMAGRVAPRMQVTKSKRGRERSWDIKSLKVRLTRGIGPTVESTSS